MKIEIPNFKFKVGQELRDEETSYSVVDYIYSIADSCWYYILEDSREFTDYNRTWHSVEEVELENVFIANDTLEIIGDKKDIQEHWEVYYKFLEELRHSGDTNMFGAAPYLVKEFRLTLEQSVLILNNWMRNYSALNIKYNWNSDEEFD